MRNERLDDFSWDRRRMDWDVVVATAQEKWRNTDPAEGKTFWDRTVKNSEFWVSTGVDLAVSVAVGVAAAAVVAGAIAGLVALGVTVAATAPLWLTVGATAAVGIYLGIKVESWGIARGTKTAINTWIDNLLEGTNH